MRKNKKNVPQKAKHDIKIEKVLLVDERIFRTNDLVKVTLKNGTHITGRIDDITLATDCFCLTPSHILLDISTTYEASESKVNVVDIYEVEKIGSIVNIF